MLHMKVESLVAQRSPLSVLKPATRGTSAGYLTIEIGSLRVSVEHPCTFLKTHSLMQLNGKTEAGPSLVKSGHLFARMLMETGPVMPRVMPGKCRF